jgi:hypothetical protein
MMLKACTEILLKEHIYQKGKIAVHWWLTPVILANEKIEIRRTDIQRQPR